MNKLNAVIFDLDGVICFTDKYHFQAWKKLADEEGIYFDEEINDRLRGVSRMDSLDIILERAFREYTQEEKTQMAARKNESYVHLLDQMSPADLSVEVKDTLDELRKRGYKLAIGSSSKNTKKILKQIGLGDYFDAISDGRVCGGSAFQGTDRRCPGGPVPEIDLSGTDRYADGACPAGDFEILPGRMPGTGDEIRGGAP